MSVRVERLTKHFDERSRGPAVDDVSFVAPPGAITALLGPSGSGKTTVLRLVAGLERPDRGRVLIGDRDFTDVPVRKRGVGFVFQGYALFQHMTVRKNIAFGLEVRRLPRGAVAAKVADLLALVQLDAHADRYPHQLSGGQRQRVAFARALATDPAVLLLDEPFGALDAQVRLELRAWLRGLHERTAVTTLLVTHDQEEALEVSERVVVMHEGRVEQVGAPQEIYDRPATPFVASFIGQPSLLRGRIEAGRASVGSHSLSAPHGAPEGSAVRAFVRPTDVRIARPPEVVDGSEGGSKVSLSLIEALTRVGGNVKVELRLPSKERLSIQMSRLELESMGLAVGDRVMVDLGEAKIFVEDYSI
ncbi:MAG: sulfate/molybdate ABC transporter ATP-binding protein [Myxococcales bacterium]